LRFSPITARWHWLFLLALPLTAFAAYYGQGLSTHGDNLLHLYRLVALHKNVVEGNFYPRWVAELFLGFGYPLLNFYASATYYLAELLHLAGAGYENALIYAMLVLLIVASFGIYRLARDIFADLGVASQMPALVATAAYVFAPYLLFNLYVRGAIAELGAQAILPWLLWAFRRLLCSKEPAKYLIGAVFCLAALAFTHTVSLLLAPPVLVIYALVLLWRYRREPRELRRRLLWFAAATASAAAVSAVFWLPALLERQFLTTQAQEASALYIHQHTWGWKSFLDSDWFVGYNDEAGTRLRRVQLLLAIIGIVASRRWNLEWFFMVALAFFACLLVGDWAVPFWTSNPLLLTIQFPWRMLTLASVPIALLTGGILTSGWLARRSNWPYQALLFALVIGTIVFANYPRMAWMNRLEVAPDQVNLTSISQYEAITKRYGLSAATFREFTPRWVEKLEFKSLPPVAGEKPVAISLEHASDQALEMTFAAARPTRLLFSILFFPGWQITLDKGQHLEPYPSADFGLLTVDLPAGEHQLSVRWEDTLSHRWGQAITILAMLALGIFCLSRPALRLWVFYPLAPLVMVAGLVMVAPRLAPPYYPTPDQPVDHGLQLLGYTTYQEDAEAIYFFPHWLVKQTPADLILNWQLLNQAGSVVATLHSFPYFNTLRAFQWSANMLVDDGYYFPLPPGLAAGVYTLALSVTPTGTAPPGDLPPARPVGQIQIAHNVPPLPEFAHPLHVQFQATGGDNQVTLRGYHVTRDPSSQAIWQTQATGTDLTVAPGDTLTYTLYWQSAQAVPVGIQVFDQLLDHNQATLSQVNQPLELSQGAPYYLWNPYWVRANSYRLHIPEDADGGLYRPYIGVYNLETKERFAASEADGTEIGDAIFLPPVKVARSTMTPLANVVAVQFGDTIQLQNYEVALPNGELQPQTTLTLTVQYRSLSPMTVDYTQFVHLYDAELGMAAQFDAPPEGNGNPTSTWIPGEVIVDTIPLTIAEDAKPGRYTLSLGLYDPAAGGARLPVLQDNQLQPDGQFVMEEVEVK
jgi:hypothetical protein